MVENEEKAAALRTAIAEVHTEKQRIEESDEMHIPAVREKRDELEEHAGILMKMEEELSE
jgi:hypothetical protein